MGVLSEQETSERLSRHDGWSAGSQSIARDFEFPDFRSAVAFVNLVADAAEEQNHHPDILVHGWNKVRLTLSTHSEGGVTDADFQLAGRIDRLA
jgi:4a-hydroxytetrahydrobiopterin dehydratase